MDDPRVRALSDAFIRTLNTNPVSWCWRPVGVGCEARRSKSAGTACKHWRRWLGHGCAFDQAVIKQAEASLDAAKSQPEYAILVLKVGANVPQFMLFKGHGYKQCLA